MTQQDFIWETRDYNVNQKDDGVTSSYLRAGVLVTHNFKKRNIVHITFEETNERFMILTRMQLRYLVELNRYYPDSSVPMKEFCEKCLMKD